MRYPYKPRKIHPEMVALCWFEWETNRFFGPPFSRTTPISWVEVDDSASEAVPWMGFFGGCCGLGVWQGRGEIDVLKFEKIDFVSLHWEESSWGLYIFWSTWWPPSFFTPSCRNLGTIVLWKLLLVQQGFNLLPKAGMVIDVWACLNPVTVGK